MSDQWLGFPIFFCSSRLSVQNVCFSLSWMAERGKRELILLAVSFCTVRNIPQPLLCELIKWWPLGPQKWKTSLALGEELTPPHLPWTIHLWLGRRCSREDISGACQASETTLIFPLLLISNDTQKTLTCWGTALAFTFSTAPNIPTLFSRYKKEDDASSQRKTDMLGNLFSPWGWSNMGIEAQRGCRIAMLGTTQTSAGHGPAQPYPSLTTIPTNLYYSVILCISKIQRYG